MKTHILIIVEASACNGLPSENQGQFMGMIRNYLVSPIGVKVLECDDIQATLASEGVRAIETEDYL